MNYGMNHEEMLVRKIREMKEENIMAREYIKSMKISKSLASEEQKTKLALRFDELIGRKLAMTSERLRAIMNSPTCGAETSREIRSLYDEVENSIRDALELSIELSPAALYEQGLARAVQWISASVEKRFGITKPRAGQEFPTGLDLASRVILYQAIREIL